MQKILSGHFYIFFRSVFPFLLVKKTAIILIKTTKHTQKKLSEINFQKEQQSGKELFHDIKTVPKQYEATHHVSRLVPVNCYVMTNLFLIKDIKEHFHGSNTRQSGRRSMPHPSLFDHLQSKMSTRSD